MLIDSHAHLDAPEFDSDRLEVLKRASANHLSAIISCGTTLESSKKNLALASENPFLYAGIGIHPHDTYQIEANTFQNLKKLSAQPKVVAIGETGLDYHYNFSLPEVQKKGFASHIRLAREIGLPLVVHSREAEKDLLQILKEEKASEVGGVLHCFTGTLELAKPCLELGFYFGVSGIITFKNAGMLCETFQELPLDRLLIETDSPYLAPTPHRGKRNEPSYILQTAQKLAELKNLPVEKIYEQTTENTKKLFRLP